MVGTIQILWEFSFKGNSSTLLQSLYCLNARPPDLECHKLSEFWYQSYIIIAYIINFQVQSTPGQLQIRFALYVFGICLWINWVLELKKVSQTTASLALRNMVPEHRTSYSSKKLVEHTAWGKRVGSGGPSKREGVWVCGGGAQNLGAQVWGTWR